jgi:hypothetical protein
MHDRIDLDQLPIERVYEWLTGHSPYTERQLGAGRRPNQILAKCVARASHKHGDANPSLSINIADRVFSCKSCGIRGKTLELIVAAGKHQQMTGPGLSERQRAMLWLRQQIGIPLVHPRPHPPHPQAESGGSRRFADERLVATHVYVDELGNELFRYLRIKGAASVDGAKRSKRMMLIRPRPIASLVGARERKRERYVDDAEAHVFDLVRYENGSRTHFVLEYPDARREHVALSRGNARVVPYRLPAIRAAAAAGRAVVFVEGESSADALAAVDFAATTYPNGARNEPDAAALIALKGVTRAFVVEDPDEPGRSGAARLRACLARVVPTVYRVDLTPGRDDGYDVRDLIDDLRASGMTDEAIHDELERRIRNAAVLESSSARSGSSTRTTPRKEQRRLATSETHVDLPYVAVRSSVSDQIRIMPLAEWERYGRRTPFVTAPLPKAVLEQMPPSRLVWLTAAELRARLPRRPGRPARACVASPA